MKTIAFSMVTVVCSALHHPAQNTFVLVHHQAKKKQKIWEENLEILTCLDSQKIRRHLNKHFLFPRPSLLQEILTKTPCDTWERLSFLDPLKFEDTPAVTLSRGDLYTGNETCDARALPVESSISSQSSSVRYDVRMVTRAKEKELDSTRRKQWHCEFIKMNVLRTCKQLSRLGQSTVSFFISLTLIIVRFHRLDLPEESCTLRFTASTMHVIYKGRCLDLS